MSARRVLRAVLVEWKELGIPRDLVPRIHNVTLDGHEIVVITGVRRSGKTYLMFQLMKELIERGVDENRVFYVNFEDERIEPRTEFLTELLPAIREEFGVSENIYLFLDEIHNIPGWSKWLRRHELRPVKFVISGSSAVLTPRRIAEELGGRTLTYILYPLSFREFLRFKGVRLDEHVDYSERRYDILRLLREYIEYGGFPEVVLTRDPIKKVMKLQEYFHTIVYRDIVRRHTDIRRTDVLEAFLRLLVETTHFTASKTANTLKSAGYSVSKDTILKYKRYAEEAMFVYQVPVLGRSVKDAMQHPRKIYFVDTGLRRAVSTRYASRFSNLFENAVFMYLLRTLKPLERIAYWRSREGYEVDFAIERVAEVRRLVQAAYEIDEETAKREERALIAAMAELGLREGLIVTWDHEEEKRVGPYRIKYVPLWKLLLREPETATVHASA